MKWFKLIGWRGFCMPIMSTYMLIGSFTCLLYLFPQDTFIQLLIKGRYPLGTGIKYTSSCDYTVGKWVKTNAKPLYSGESCKRWLSGPWACRLSTNRPDFEYEKYRWQPSECDLPLFNSRRFLRRMSNKVILFIGDSIGRQQHQSLMCMLTGGKEDKSVEDVGFVYGLELLPGARRPDGVAHRFIKTNTTIIHYWSVLLCDIRPINETDPNTFYSVHLDRPPPFLEKFIDIMDVIVLNSGHHWNRGKMVANKWIHYMNGEPFTDLRFQTLDSLRRLLLTKLMAWIDDKITHNNTKAEVYMRSLSPRHFFGGEWDSGGRCDNNIVPVEKKNVSSRQVVDKIAEDAVRGTKIHLLNITYISAFRDDAHISKYKLDQQHQDCLHWCLPGVPDAWNEILYAELLDRF